MTVMARPRPRRRRRARHPEPVLLLPSRPLALYIRHVAERERIRTPWHDDLQIDSVISSVCRRAGIDSRRYRAWTGGEQPLIPLTTVDAVIVGLDALWWDAYNETTVRGALLEIRVYAPQSKRAAGRTKVWRGKRLIRIVRIGDTGPDLQQLERIRRVWECDDDGTPWELAA